MSGAWRRTARWCAAALASAVTLIAAPNGRWDLQVSSATISYPGWLEITGEGDAVRVRYVGRVGNVREIGEFQLGARELRFARNEWFGAYEVVEHVFRFEEGKVSGVFRRKNGDTLTVSGVPAPQLERAEPKAWSAPRSLFNGRDFTGWMHSQQPTPAANWRVDAGELVTFAGGGDLRTVETFEDFKLRLEFFNPVNGNSGVYLRGRYELQIEDDSPKAPPQNQTGAIYGWVAPTTPVKREAGRWCSLEVTLVGRRVSVVLDGVTLYAGAEIPGITGGAMDSNEGAPGPIVLQASHSKTRGEVRFRNVTVATPAR